MDELKRKRFLWGVLLAWLPWILIGLGLINWFHGASGQKATGLGAVALSPEGMGFAIALLFEPIAIVLLSRSFSRGHWLRTSLSVVSICLSVSTISVFGFLLWTFLDHLRRMA